MPSEERVFACFGGDLISDTFQALRGKRRISWFERAAERAERRASVSAEADRTHKEIWNDWVNAYSEEACSEAYVRGAEDALQDLQQCYGSCCNSASETETSDMSPTLSSRRLAKAGKKKEKRSGRKSVRFRMSGEVESEVDSEVGLWQKSESRRNAECQAIRNMIKKLKGKGKEGTLIRMRGGRGGEKALVKRKKGGQEKPKPKPNRGLGGFGEVNDVEWQDVWRTYKKGARKERWVRCL